MHVAPETCSQGTDGGTAWLQHVAVVRAGTGSKLELLAQENCFVLHSLPSPTCTACTGFPVPSFCPVPCRWSCTGSNWPRYAVHSCLFPLGITPLVVLWKTRQPLLAFDVNKSSFVEINTILKLDLPCIYARCLL